MGKHFGPDHTVSGQKLFGRDAANAETGTSDPKRFTTHCDARWMFAGVYTGGHVQGGRGVFHIVEHELNAAVVLGQFGHRRAPRTTDHLSTVGLGLLQQTRL